MNDMNIDKNTMDNIKNMVDNGNISEAISQISPEMIQNFSKMFAQNNNNSNSQNNTSDSNNSSNDNNSQNSTGNNNFDLNEIDINNIMKLASSFNSQQNDPRSNLLNSLKPYLRDGKKEKLNNYINLMNMGKIAELLKNNPNINKENS